MPFHDIKVKSKFLSLSDHEAVIWYSSKKIRTKRFRTKHLPCAMLRFRLVRINGITVSDGVDPKRSVFM